MKPRFVIKTGKWGCYFYDTLENKDVTLQEAVDLMNQVFPLVAEIGSLKLKLASQYVCDVLKAE